MIAVKKTDGSHRFLCGLFQIEAFNNKSDGQNSYHTPAAKSFSKLDCIRVGLAKTKDVKLPKLFRGGTWIVIF